MIGTLKNFHKNVTNSSGTEMLLTLAEGAVEPRIRMILYRIPKRVPGIIGNFLISDNSNKFISLKVRVHVYMVKCGRMRMTTIILLVQNLTLSSLK